MPDKLPRPSVDTFSDYRAFIAAMIVWLRQQRPGVSYRTLAEDAGFGSKSFLKHVVDGDRNLGEGSVAAVATALGLSSREAAVFATMVRFGQAKTDALQETAFSELMRARRDPTARTERGQFDAYSRWFPMVLRELVGMPRFREDPAWLGRRLRPRVAAKTVKAALGLLERLELLGRDDAEALRQTDAAISTGAQVRSLMVRTFHRKMLELSQVALDKLPPSQRNVTGLMLPLRPDQYDRLVALISEFRADVRRTFEEDADPLTDQDTADVYQLLVSLIPLTKQVKDR